MSTDREQLSDVVASLGITCTAVAGGAVGKPPNWGGKATKPQAPPQNWRVTLRYGRRTLTTNFYGGGAVPTPDAARVLGSLLLDISGADQDFDQWCADYGYDTDSRSALATYRACVAIRPRVLRFLGEDYEHCANAEY